MKKLLVVISIFFVTGIGAQELYVFSEPASNMPSKSISLKLGSMFEKGVHSNRILQRHTPEIMFGLNKNWMVHASTTIANMHQEKFTWESARLYGKFRFLSIDEVHKHFRMAAFAAASYSRNHLDHNEINLQGDQSGVQAGLIVTQLWNRVAVSGSASLNEVLHEYRRSNLHSDMHAFSAINYSLSAGFLVLPVEYTDYNQTNLNLYLELLGSRNLRWPTEKYYVDLAPAIQFIFNSTAKLNFGYRFQLSGDIYRLSNQSFMVGFEYIFLDALK